MLTRPGPALLQAAPARCPRSSRRSWGSASRGCPGCPGAGRTRRVTGRPRPRAVRAREPPLALPAPPGRSSSLRPSRVSPPQTVSDSGPKVCAGAPKPTPVLDGGARLPRVLATPLTTGRSSWVPPNGHWPTKSTAPLAPPRTSGATSPSCHPPGRPSLACRHCRPETGDDPPGPPDPLSLSLSLPANPLPPGGYGAGSWALWWFLTSRGPVCAGLRSRHRGAKEEADVHVAYRGTTQGRVVHDPAHRGGAP